MTATATAAAPRAAFAPVPTGHQLSAVGLLRSEWTKFWSLRSSWIVLLCTVVVGTGIGVIVAATYDGWAQGSGDHPIEITHLGVALSSLFIAVLGVLTMTGEYSTGSIRSTMAAAPKRLSVLWAKAAVFGGIVFVFYSAMVFGTFVVTQALLDGTDLGGVALSDPGVVRVLLGLVVLVTYMGLLGLGLGAILRNSAGAIGFYVGVIMILPNLALLLPWQWVRDVWPYTPGNTTDTLIQIDTANAALSLGESWAWTGGWLVLAFGLAAVLLKRRDV
jgi:ABC-2 type transport system permease protein